MNRTERPDQSNLFYLATFFVAAATLTYEITLSRIFSVVTYYYLAFSAISLAMLGGTAGAVTVFLRKKYFAASFIPMRLPFFCLLFSGSLLITTAAFQFIPIVQNAPFERLISFAALVSFGSLPFYFSGIVITLCLTRKEYPVHKVYAADLAGAAAGCLLALFGLEFLDAPSLIVFCGVPPLASALLFSGGNHFRFRMTVIFFAAIILALSFSNFFTHNAIRPVMVKGQKENPKQFLYEKWNAHSRVTVDHPRLSFPQYWGPSPLAPRNHKILQYKMTIDGDAGTVLRKYDHPDDLRHLEYDMVNFAYHIQPGGRVCIIGAGGGKDIQTALHFGSTEVTALEINSTITDLLHNRFREVAKVANTDKVNIVNEEARTYLSATPERYNLIQMALIDTWASTGSGAFSMSENTLYTVEAWKMILSRLSKHGLFTVSRWYNPENLGETGRLTALAIETLLQSGAVDPSRHMALLTINNLSTLLLSREPFTKMQINQIISKSSTFQFNVVFAPGKPPGHVKLNAMLTSSNSRALATNSLDALFNYSAPTDEDPYFFNMLKFGKLHYNSSSKQNTGVMSGNLQATVTLFYLLCVLVFFAVATCLIPFLTLKITSQQMLAPSLYFILIGAGFILAEMGLVQCLSVFLGHPAYALGIILFTVILSTGAGSMLHIVVKKLLGQRISWLPVIALVLVAGTNELLRFSIGSWITGPLWFKIGLSVLIISPLGVVLGQFFPLGAELVSRQQENLAWFWALNGVTTVVFSVVAIFIAVYAGISYNFYLAAAAYGSLFFCTRYLRIRQNDQAR